MKFGVQRRPDPWIDVTPMIDIVFQLVLFFMVSTNFIESPGFEVELPQSSSQTVLSEDRDMQVWITTDGSVYVDDVAVSSAALAERFRQRAAENPDTLVIIKADTGVPHGRVVAVMDRARARGLTRLAIATESTTTEEP